MKKPNNDEIPDDVVNIFISEVMNTMGSGCKNHEDFLNILTKLYNGEKVKRARLKQLTVGPNVKRLEKLKNRPKIKMFKTNITHWTVMSYVRIDGENSNLVFNNKTYSKIDIVLSSKFSNSISEIANNFGSRVYVNYGEKLFKKNLKKKLKKNFDSVDDIFDSVNDIKPNSLILFRFKKNIPIEEIQKWQDENPHNAKTIEKTIKKIYNLKKEKKEKQEDKKMEAMVKSIVG